MALSMPVSNHEWWKSIATGARWVAFIPGGLFGGLLAAGAVGVLFALKVWFHDEGLIAPLGPFISAGVLGYVSVVCATCIAPTRSRTIPAIAMSIVMFMLYGLFVSACVAEQAGVELAKCVITVAAVVFALCQQIMRTD